MISKSGCVECGSPVFFDEFDFMTTCSTCGTAFRLPRDNSGAWVLTYASEIDINEAIDRGVSIISAKFGGKRFAKEIELKEVYPVYLPLWNVSAKSSGWICSSDAEGGEALPVHLEKQFRIPAYDDVQTIGVPKEVNGTDVTISNDMVFPALHVKIRTDELKRKVEELMDTEIDGFRHTKQSAENIRTSVTVQTLVMYPAWIVRFGTRNGEHAVTIDGISGQQMNDFGFRVTDTGIVGEAVLAACCGITSGTGVMMLASGAFQNIGLGLVTAGVSLFVLVNVLRHVLKSQHLNPRPEARRMSI